MARVNDRIRNCFRKRIRNNSIIVLSILSSVTLTACNLSFKNTPETILPAITDTINAVVEDTESLREENLSQTIDTIIEESEKIAKKSNSEFVKASVIRVVDGDTLVVNIDNTQTKVRLIGIDTPESVASDEYLIKTGKKNSIEGKNASDFTKSILADYSEVYLEKDISETDKYGRLLRYVWLDVPDDKTDLDEISSKMLNAILVKEGYAKSVRYKPDIEYSDYFDELER